MIFRISPTLVFAKLINFCYIFAMDLNLEQHFAKLLISHWVYIRSICCNVLTYIKSLTFLVLSLQRYFWLKKLVFLALTSKGVLSSSFYLNNKKLDSSNIWTAASGVWGEAALDLKNSGRSGPVHPSRPLWLFSKPTGSSGCKLF